jgi:hypothetical protein
MRLRTTPRLYLAAIVASATILAFTDNLQAKQSKPNIVVIVGDDIGHWNVGASAGSFLVAHLKSLQEYPPRRGGDTLSMKKATDYVIRKMETPTGSSN